MAKFLVTVTTSDDADFGVSGDDTQSCKNLAGFFDKVASGNTGAATLRILNDGVAATGSVVVSGALTADDTVIIGTTTLTAKAIPATEDEFAATVSTNADAAALSAAINAHSTLSKVVVASVVTGTVTVTSLYPGVLGNHIRLAEGTDTGNKLAVTAMANGAETTITFST